jgi:hypothetical protein
MRSIPSGPFVRRARRRTAGPPPGRQARNPSLRRARKEAASIIANTNCRTFVGTGDDLGRARKLRVPPVCRSALGGAPSH